MVSRASLRASDTDREAVAERLRQAFYDGRIFSQELEDRLGAALAARTYGELETLTADLPAPALPPAAAEARPSSLRIRAASLLTAALMLCALSIACASLP